MQHKGTVLLETERLILRPFVEADIEPSYRNWTSEAFSEIIRFFFEEVKVQRIEAQHDPDNPGSGKVMEKYGLIYEGTLRKADWNNRGIVDACIYGMLAKDYFK